MVVSTQQATLQARQPLPLEALHSCPQIGWASAACRQGPRHQDTAQKVGEVTAGGQAQGDAQSGPCLPPRLHFAIGKEEAESQETWSAGSDLELPWKNAGIRELARGGQRKRVCGGGSSPPCPVAWPS